MSEFRIDLDAVRKSLNGHSVFSPSGSFLWLNCAGGLIANLLAPDDAGEDAAYGTVGHSVGEQWLRDGVKPAHRIGEVVEVQEGDQVFSITIDNAMMDYVERYVLWCAPLPGTHYVEQRFTYSHLTPLEDQGGTTDHAALTYQHGIITDLKMGMGDKVYAERNSQAMLYALGTLYEWDWFYDFQRFTIRIAQPRLSHFDEWEVTREELLEFAEFVKVRAQAAWQPNAPRTPSPKACRWCRVSTSCTARLMQLTALASGNMSFIGKSITETEMQELKESLANGAFELELADPKRLSTEDLSILYPYIDTAKAWWEKLNGEIYRRAMAGQNVSSAKLVKGRGGRRKWINPKMARKVLTRFGASDDDIVEVRSPAQVEEVLRGIGYARSALPSLLDGLTSQEAPGLRLVPVQDKAQAETPGAMYDNAFDDLNVE